MVVMVSFSKFYASGANMCDKNIAVCNMVITWFLALPNVEDKTKLVCLYPGCGDTFNLIMFLAFMFLAWRTIIGFDSRNGLANLLACAVKKGRYC